MAATRPSSARRHPTDRLGFGYVVLFDAGSSSLTRRARSTLDDLARRWNLNGGVVLELVGHTDQQEARADSPALALQRANVVKAYLASQGVEGQRIITEGRGASQPRVSVDGPDLQNRRVEPFPVFRPTDEDRQDALDRLTCQIWVRDHCFTPSRLAHAGAAACTAALNAATGP